jgi:N6-adenosine-specific RNA methylase IME4
MPNSRARARVNQQVSMDRDAADDLLRWTKSQKFGTILADPPWRFSNRTGKMAPEHRRLSRYATMSHEAIMELPVPQVALPEAHLYLWVPNALILEGLDVMRRWGFTYKTNIVWFKVRKDGGPDGRGVGFYFRNVTELVLFGVRGRMRTLKPGRTQVNLLATRKRRHSQKPDELYRVIERCSPGPHLELFARSFRPGWDQWGDEFEKAPLRLISSSPTDPPGSTRHTPKKHQLVSK